MLVRLIVASLLLLPGCAEQKPIPTPPSVLDSDSPLSPASPIFATSSELYIASRGSAPGIYRLDLGTGESEQLVAGKVRHVRVDEELVAILGDETSSSLARVSLADGAAVLETLTYADTLASASAGGYTFVVERPDPGVTNTKQIRRLATGTEPALVLLDVNRGDYDEYINSFYGEDGQLFWVHINGIMRIASDGSETEPTWLDSGGNWDDFVILGDGGGSTERWLLGQHEGEVLALRNEESFFATGGRWSNGDEKGYDDFGGGAIYTVSTDSEAEARLIRGDIRSAVLAEGLIYAQTLEGLVERIDPATGIGVPIATQTPHGIIGNARLVANQRAVYYASSGQIFELELR